jgi:hypothetical protein
MNQDLIPTDKQDYLAMLKDADGQATTETDFVFIGLARCKVFRRAEQKRSILWVLQAEQVYCLRNDLKTESVGVGDSANGPIEGDISKPLWKWCSGADDWEMFCWDELGISKPHARLLERTWETYRLKLGFPTKRIEQQGKQKSINALAVANEDIDSRGELDEDLETLLQEGTNREVLDYVRDRRDNPGMNRQPLSWEHGIATFWDSERQPHKFAVGLDRVRLLAPPDGIGIEDRMLWGRKQKEYMRLMGGE